MHDLDPMPGVQAVGHDRAVARFRVGLDAEQARPPSLGKLCHQWLEVDPIEDLPRVSLPIGGCKLDPGSLAHAQASILGVLELPELGGRRELGMMAVADLGASQCVL
jgi:hypothetical protein